MIGREEKEEGMERKNEEREGREKHINKQTNNRCQRRTGERNGRTITSIGRKGARKTGKEDRSHRGGKDGRDEGRSKKKLGGPRALGL